MPHFHLDLGRGGDTMGLHSCAQAASSCCHTQSLGLATLAVAYNPPRWLERLVMQYAVDMMAMNKTCTWSVLSLTRPFYMRGSMELLTDACAPDYKHQQEGHHPDMATRDGKKVASFSDGRRRSEWLRRRRWRSNSAILVQVDQIRDGGLRDSRYGP